jgi:hypothetical protein
MLQIPSLVDLRVHPMSHLLILQLVSRPLRLDNPAFILG